MTLVDEVEARDDREAVVLGYFRYMKRKDWERFGELWDESAVQNAVFLPDGLESFVPDRFEARETLMTHYKRGLANRREHEFWIDWLHRTEDPNCFIVECRAHSVVGENDRVYENQYVFIFTLRDGKIARLTEYANPLPIMRAFTGVFE